MMSLGIDGALPIRCSRRIMRHADGSNTIYSNKICLSQLLSHRSEALGKYFSLEHRLNDQSYSALQLLSFASFGHLMDSLVLDQIYSWDSVTFKGFKKNKLGGLGVTRYCRPFNALSSTTASKLSFNFYRCTRLELFSLFCTVSLDQTAWTSRHRLDQDLDSLKGE